MCQKHLFEGFMKTFRGNYENLQNRVNKSRVTVCAMWRAAHFVKVILQQAEVALGVPGNLRPRIFSTFGTTRVVGRQPNASAAFTSGEIPGTHFQRLSRP